MGFDEARISGSLEVECRDQEFATAIGRNCNGNLPGDEGWLVWKRYAYKTVGYSPNCLEICAIATIVNSVAEIRPDFQIWIITSKLEGVMAGEVGKAIRPIASQTRSAWHLPRQIVDLQVRMDPYE
jgi:hypothetical protein